MRGLAFPSNAAVDREPSYETGTPISIVDDIPIDPALGGAAIDPALMMEDEGPNVAQQPPPENQHLQPPQPPQDDYQARQYSEGPQGDPFAPQIPVPYFPMEQEQPPPPPKPKRKRKIVREEECSFCGGKDTNNKHNEPEALITCHECGRSGHPSCMQLERLSDVVRTYPWKCIECKNCEVCQEKGDDDRILFCDWCDRGWHMDCMDPPLLTAPEGEWHCPECPPVVPTDQLPPPPEQYAVLMPEEPHVQSPIPSMRETSVASTSRSAIVPDPPVTAPKSRSRKKAPAKPRVRAPTRAAAAADDGEASDIDNSVAVDETPTVAPRARGRTSRGGAAAASTSTAKGKARAPSTSSEDEPAPARPLKRRRAPARQPSPTPAAPLPRVRLRIPAQRGKGKEREEDEHGMFDDILAPEERDTTKTKVLNIDKVYFERSRLAAEDKLAPPPPPPTASSSRTPAPDEPLSARSRPLRSSTLHTPLKRPDLDLSSFSLHSNSPAPSTPGGAPQYPKFDPGTLRIRSIRFGPWEIKTWYDAPFPEEYATIPDGRLWICEFCLKYMKSRFGAVRHQMKCKTRHPPGDEIYRDGNVSIFEVDGRRNKIYCQNLCLLSKMFLDHKSLFYDVEPFLFYVITQVDEFGARFVGYFSKEKRCPKDYNLSCIMTLPVRQRQGWGNFVIDFSYLLSKVEQRLGSPEKPLSSLGALGYKNYWTLAVMRFLATAPDNVKLEEISSATSMTHEDVCNTLIQQNMIFIREPTPPPIKPSPGQAIKYPKGRKNGIARRQLQRLQSQQHLQDKDGSGDGKGRPFALPKHYEIHFDRAKVQEYLSNWEKKGYMRLKPEKLQWTPYIVSRTSQEAGVAGDQPAMDTVRDEQGRTPFVLEDGDGAGQRQQERSQTSTEPTTPAPANGRRRRVEEAEEEEERDEGKRDELPSMVVDRTSSPEPEPEPLVRTRTRSGGVKSATKEKEAHPRPRKTSRARSPSPTPLAPSASRRTRSTNSNLPAPPVPAVIVDEPRSTRRSSNNNSRRPPPPPKGTAANHDDAALAAKLAAEEEKQRPTRMLRSRRSESQVENKKPVSMVVVPIPSPTKPPPPRKRRRIESSPEVEAVEAPSPSPSPPPPEPEPEEPPEPEETLEDEEDAPMDVDQAEAGLPLVNGHCQEEEEEEGSSPVGVEMETLTPENTDATTLVDVQNGSATTEEPEEEAEVKGRAEDVVVFMGGKFSPYRAVHAESDIRSTLMAVVVDDLHDEDADGEYEEDADGEVDPEFM